MTDWPESENTVVRDGGKGKGERREEGEREKEGGKREKRGKRKGSTETLKANTLMVHSSHPLAKAFIPIFLPMSPTSTPG